MDIRGKIVVVTGAASGIGRALCDRFAAEGAAGIACVDRDAEGLAETAERVKARAFVVDVTQDSSMAEMIGTVEKEMGPIDLFCSNAGIFMHGGVERPDADWTHIWNVNVMSQVIAARHMVPRMAARGGGYLLNTASAAGLLNQIGGAPYGVTKHAAVGLAEWLALTHGDQGIKVSVLCPQAVDTAMTAGGAGVAGLDGVLSAEQVAQCCIEALRDETFLILPHEEVATYMQAKARDYDRWLGAMAKLNAQFT